MVGIADVGLLHVDHEQLLVQQLHLMLKHVILLLECLDLQVRVRVRVRVIGRHSPA